MSSTSAMHKMAYTSVVSCEIRPCPLNHRKAMVEEYCAKHHDEAVREEFIKGDSVSSWIASRLIVDEEHRCPR